MIWALQTHRPAFLEKRPWYNCLPSLESLTNSPDGIAALKEAHAALQNPTARRKTDPEPLTQKELSQGAVLKDSLSTFELRNAFLGGSKDLMTFLSELEGSLSGASAFFIAEEGEPPDSEANRLTLFCRLAAEFYEDFRMSEECREAGAFLYPLIYPR